MDWVLLVFVAVLTALMFIVFKVKGLLKLSQGNEKMKEISKAIKSGAKAYLKRQYITVGIFFAALFVVLLVLAFAFKLVNPYVPFAFLTGGIFSGLCGYIGMSVATSSNSRTAEAAKDSLNKGLKCAFSAGSVMGFMVVGLGLTDMLIWYTLLKYVFVVGDATAIATTMVTFGVGASCMALFARVGGGIFTKAADVGADLVGKVEAGIPEDDPRNPAVIADNVGDNVGDVAGMGADLYESYVGSILSAISLGVLAFSLLMEGYAGILLPFAIAGAGVMASFIGTFFIRTKENTSQKSLLMALRKGTWIAAALSAVFSFFLIWLILGIENIRFFSGIVSGLLAGVLIGFFTEYYTSDNYKPTKNLAESAKSGAGPVVINGMSLGMRSTFIPTIIIVCSVLASYFIGGAGNGGMFTVALSAVGMLSTLGITLATDAYGPVADNAGGIAEMSGMDASVRQRTDALDSLGNTTAATGKGFAIGSALLTSLALIFSFMALVENAGTSIQLSLVDPKVLMGLVLGAALPFLFSALTMRSVGKSAESIVVEVRRQFKENVGIMEGTTPPDYKRCVDICTRSALKEIILPAIIAIISPIITAFFLGINGVAALLCGNTITGFLLAIMMSNAGGAWDNAKKSIEASKEDGKGSERHKAAVVGDTVGDPFKDTSGPSINILIKLVSIVSIVFVNVLIALGGIL